MNEQKNKRLLLTGSRGMLGSYLRDAFSDSFDITGLSRSGMSGSICCDLAAEVPQLPEEPFDVVVHAAGTRDEAEAISVNLEGTRHLLSALEKNPPGAMVFISDAAVYGLSHAGDIDETANTWTSDKVGQSKILAEEEMRKFADAHALPLLILRPAPMFGRGMNGEMALLFSEVAGARYIHLRGNDARRGIVTAYDVSRAARVLAGQSGIYNVADGYNRTLLDLVNAMSSNTGHHKRMVFLPPKWAAVGARIPGLSRLLDPEKFKRRAVSLTYNADRLKEATGLKLFDTVEVIARRDPDYPYADA